MSEKDYTVSIVIPCYNSANTITYALNSVFQQTLTDYEVIIVNDGSYDDTEKVVHKIFEQNPDVSYHYIYQSNRGVSSARNRGIKEANGKYIAFLDSDDEWVPTKLERQLSVMQESNILFLGSLMNLDSVFNPRNKAFVQISLRRMQFKCYFGPPSVVVHCSIFEKVGLFDEHLSHAEEGNMWIRIAAEFQTFLLTENLVIAGRNKPRFGYSGLSGNLKKMERGELKNLKYAHKNLGISVFVYLLAVAFSLVKYLRRVLIVKLRSLSRRSGNE